MIEWWELFRNDSLSRDVKETSLATYKWHIIPFLNQNPPVRSKIDLFNFLAGRYKNLYTRRKAWENLRTFFKWAVQSALMDNWFAGFRMAAPAPEPPPVLTREEFMRLLNCIPNTSRGYRDRALLSVYFSTGARRNSILRLRRDDLDLENRWMYLRSMKGGKQVSKPIPQSAANYLAEWLKVAPASPWVFPSLRIPAKHLDSSAVTHCIPKYARLAGFPENRRIYTHLLRHSFATELARQGQPAEVIMQCLDHSDIRMSLHYVRRSAFRVREVTDLVFGEI